MTGSSIKNSLPFILLCFKFHTKKECTHANTHPYAGAAYCGREGLYRSGWWTWTWLQWCCHVPDLSSYFSVIGQNHKNKIRVVINQNHHLMKHLCLLIRLWEQIMKIDFKHLQCVFPVKKKKCHHQCWISVSVLKIPLWRNCNVNCQHLCLFKCNREENKM